MHIIRIKLNYRTTIGVVQRELPDAIRRETTLDRPRKSPHPRPLSHKNGRGEIRQRIARAVTVIEVLFAMVVMLVGLVGMVALLPMAGRQASDSYSLTHGGAALQNAYAITSALDLASPSISRQWWYPNDDPATAVVATRFGNTQPTIDYMAFQDTRGLQSEIMKHRWVEIGSIANRDEIARRDGLAQGFCVDPLFCADQFREGWRYSSTYDHDRSGATANNQGVFRRSRMPFLDERTGIATASSGTGYEFESTALTARHELPRLVRLSFVNQITAAGLPINLQRAVAESFVRLGAGSGDIVQATPEQDKSFGALRDFPVNGNGFVSSSSDGRLTWLATLTPTEEVAPGIVPQHYNISFVVFRNRDPSFDAAPISVTGAKTFAPGEKICFATAPTATGPSVTQCGDLPFSQGGGSFEVRLWSDKNSDPKIRADDWVMLSRRIELGNASGNIEDLKIIHRHRWYRVVGTESVETWDDGIKVRLAGSAWDYPDIYYANSAGTARIASGSPAPVYGIDLISSVTDLTYVATTATVFSDVVSVFQNTIELP